MSSSRHKLRERNSMDVDNSLMEQDPTRDLFLSRGRREGFTDRHGLARVEPEGLSDPRFGPLYRGLEFRVGGYF